MVTMDRIRALSNRIAREFHPERIILFGSYASGAPDDASDVDLLVILPFEGASARKSLEIVRRIRPRFPLDLLTRTPEEVRQRLEWNDFFLKEIVDNGRVLYDSSHSRMD